jgi:hypothetical protein
MTFPSYNLDGQVKNLGGHNGQAIDTAKTRVPQAVIPIHYTTSKMAVRVPTLPVSQFCTWDCSCACTPIRLQISAASSQPRLAETSIEEACPNPHVFEGRPHVSSLPRLTKSPRERCTALSALSDIQFDDFYDFHDLFFHDACSSPVSELLTYGLKFCYHVPRPMLKQPVQGILLTYGLNSMQIFLRTSVQSPVPSKCTHTKS